MANDWRKTHPRLAWALERMEDGEFKDGLVAAADRGRLSKRQMVSLGHLANRLERAARGEQVDPPARGARQEFHISITGNPEWMDNQFGDQVYRVSFLCLDGWRGRWETTNEKLIQKIKDRPGDQARLTATVKWVKGDFGILGGRVQLVFGG